MAKKSNTSTTSSSSTTKNSSNIISQVFNKVKEDYLSTITKKVAFLDALALYSILTALTQIVYMILVGNFPFNSFLSSLIFQISIFALSVSLRLQLTSPEYKGRVSPQQSIFDFTLCAVVLIFVVFSFLG